MLPADGKEEESVGYNSTRNTRKYVVAIVYLADHKGTKKE